MTRKEERYLFSDIAVIKQQTRQNNLMLQDICNVVNAYLANHNKENEEDFGRNVVANLLSNMVELRGLKR